MLIDDEEELLKKTFKNFNAEKDPFEIPEKYLPPENKDRAGWLDKDGKPLKFLVAVKLGRVHYGVDLRYKEGDACLCISGKSKQSAFYVDGNVIFIDGLDYTMCTYPLDIGYRIEKTWIATKTKSRMHDLKRNHAFFTKQESVPKLSGSISSCGRRELPILPCTVMELC